VHPAKGRKECDKVLEERLERAADRRVGCSPRYLTALLLLKAMKTVTGLVAPLARWLPDWVPAQNLLSFLFVVIVCFLVGIAVRTSIGREARNRIENSVFQKIPGYTLFRSMTRQLAGDSGENRLEGSPRRD
jgi:uncharacterized membrane protein